MCIRDSSWIIVTCLAFVLSKYVSPPLIMSVFHMEAAERLVSVDRTPEYDYMKLLLGAQLRNRLEIDHEPTERTEPAIFWGMDQPPLVHL